MHVHQQKLLVEITYAGTDEEASLARRRSRRWRFGRIKKLGKVFALGTGLVHGAAAVGPTRSAPPS